MAEGPKSQSWWQTLPGILTAIAAILTAAAGLIVALHQAGLLDRTDRPSKEQRISGTTPDETKPSPADLAAQYPVSLSAGAEVRLGEAVYKIQEAQLDRYNTENLSLRFLIRMTNNRNYADGFWNSSFRLLVDGVPRAPTSNLNEVVAGNSAKEGEVVFVIPNTTASAVLKVIHYQETTQIPIDLEAAKRQPAAPEE